MKCNRCRSSRVEKRRLRVSTCFGADRTRVGYRWERRCTASRSPNEDTRECLGRSRRPSEVRRLVILRLLNLQANQIERNADGRWQGVSCVADCACRRQICRTRPSAASQVCISTSGRQPLALSSVGVARGRASRHGRHKGNRRLLAKLKARPRASTARRRQSGGRRRGQTPMNGRPPSAITPACLLRSD